MRRRSRMFAVLLAGVVAVSFGIRYVVYPPPGPTAAGMLAPAVDAEAGKPSDRKAGTGSCREETNGCQVCLVDAAGDRRCSGIGIACQPGEWRCADRGR